LVCRFAKCILIAQLFSLVLFVNTSFLPSISYHSVGVLAGFICVEYIHSHQVFQSRSIFFIFILLLCSSPANFWCLLRAGFECKKHRKPRVRIPYHFRIYVHLALFLEGPLPPDLVCLLNLLVHRWL